MPGQEIPIAIDFDGTIADHVFPEIGEPVPGAFEWIRKFRDAGATLVLWTMRSDGGEHGDVLTEAVEFCFEHGIDFDYVNENPQDWTTSPKAYAKTYIDDNAWGCPLKDNPNGGRPYVDWDEVGPGVMELIESYKAKQGDEEKTDSDGGATS